MGDSLFLSVLKNDHVSWQILEIVPYTRTAPLNLGGIMMVIQCFTMVESGKHRLNQTEEYWYTFRQANVAMENPPISW